MHILNILLFFKLTLNLFTVRVELGEAYHRLVGKNLMKCSEAENPVPLLSHVTHCIQQSQ